MKLNPNGSPDFPSALIALILLLGATLLGSGCASTSGGKTADEQQNIIQWRETFRETKGHELSVEPFTGRVIGVQERRGLAFFAANDVAMLGQWSTFETTGTNTIYKGYASYSFADNSSIVALVEGSGSLDGHQKGFITFVRGTGRFSGIQGSAAFTSETVSPSDSGGDTYADVRGQYELLRAITLPAQ